MLSTRLDSLTCINLSLQKECFSKEQEPMYWRHILLDKIINPTIVIRWFLTANGKEEEWRHAKKFQTRVRVEDKSANLVIDNGSAINFVAQEVIGKLNWRTEKLSKSYQVTWSNGYIIPVTHICLVSFKIGNYEDKIWCDVIHMNIAHFGRTWLFDWEVHHDKKNTFPFPWKGRRIMLCLMQSTSPSPST